MKVSSVYGPARPRTVPKPEPKPEVQSLHAASMLCRQGTSIFLNHSYARGWLCKRCGIQLDIKKLFGKVVDDTEIHK